MKYAVKRELANATAILEHDGICWPFVMTSTARETARVIGSPGFWRFKGWRTPMSTCDKCERKFPTAPVSYVHKCVCSGGMMVPDRQR